MQQAIHILFGFDEPTVEKNIIRHLQTMGYDVECMSKFSKMAVREYLSRNHECKTVILKEVCENITYTAEELAMLTEDRDVNVIIVLNESHKGTQYMQTLYAAGITCAIFQSGRRGGATPKEIANLILRPRSRKEAREYYCIANEQIDLGLLSPDAFNERFRMLSDFTFGDTLIERFVAVIEVMQPKQIRDFISRLPKDVVNELRQYEEFYKVCDALKSLGIDLKFKRPRNVRVGMPQVERKQLSMEDVTGSANNVSDGGRGVRTVKYEAESNGVDFDDMLDELGEQLAELEEVEQKEREELSRKTSRVVGDTVDNKASMEDAVKSMPADSGVFNPDEDIFGEFVAEDMVAEDMYDAFGMSESGEVKAKNLSKQSAKQEQSVGFGFDEEDNGSEAFDEYIKNGVDSKELDESTSYGYEDDALSNPGAFGFESDDDDDLDEASRYERDVENDESESAGDESDDSLKKSVKRLGDVKAGKNIKGGGFGAKKAEKNSGKKIVSASKGGLNSNAHNESKSGNASGIMNIGNKKLIIAGAVVGVIVLVIVMVILLAGGKDDSKSSHSLLDGEPVIENEQSNTIVVDDASMSNAVPSSTADVASTTSDEYVVLDKMVGYLNELFSKPLSISANSYSRDVSGNESLALAISVNDSYVGMLHGSYEVWIEYASGRIYYIDLVKEESFYVQGTQDDFSNVSMNVQVAAPSDFKYVGTNAADEYGFLRVSDGSYYYCDANGKLLHTDSVMFDGSEMVTYISKATSVSVPTEMFEAATEGTSEMVGELIGLEASASTEEQLETEIETETEVRTEAGFEAQDSEIE